MSENDRLARLMQYLWQGSPGLPESERLLLPPRPPLSRSRLTQELGITAHTLKRWVEGAEIDTRGKAKLARCCNCPIDQLEAYLRGRIDLPQLFQPLDEEGTEEAVVPEDQSDKHLLFIALSRLSVQDLAEIVNIGLGLIVARIGDRPPNAPANRKVWSLLAQMFAELSPGPDDTAAAHPLRLSIPDLQRLSERIGIPYDQLLEAVEQVQQEQGDQPPN